MEKEITGYGVCRLSLVSVRKTPDMQGAIVTQLLFGDHYEVLQEKGEWLSIRNHFDQMIGWMEAEQHHAITKEYFEQINNADFKITTDLASTILFKKNPLTILIGSVVPISNSELFKMEEQFAFNGESKSLGQKRDFEFLKQIACKYQNAPHQQGGKSPFGIDGAGLVQVVFKICGYSLPRQADQQRLEGKKVKSLGEAMPGDVVLLKKTGTTALTAGILLDEQKIIYADGKVRIDQLLEDGILRAETKVYTHSPVEIRRILSAH